MSGTHRTHIAGQRSIDMLACTVTAAAVAERYTTAVLVLCHDAVSTHADGEQLVLLQCAHYSTAL
jgi:hypothetical protein